MSDLSTLSGQEQIKKIDKNTAIKYRVVEERVDLEQLKRELGEWESMAEPGEEELIEMGKMNHPYYTIRQEKLEYLRNSLKDIK